jgi:hypothetical protein
VRAHAAVAAMLALIAPLVLTALTVLTACWTNPPPAAAPIRNAQPGPVASRPPVERPHDLSGEWSGTYSCAQGQTALTLTVERGCSSDDIAQHTCTVDGVFAFGPLPANPKVPRGSYRYTGQIADGEDGTLVLTATPGGWLEQPPGYVTVGFTATSDAARMSLRGRIDNPACGALQLNRR